MNNIGGWNWFDKIHDINFLDNNVSLYLGAMPLKSNLLGMEYRNDKDILIDNEVGAVLSVVEHFENNTLGYICSPITPNEWSLNNIKYLQVPIPDFCLVPLEKIQICVEYIHWNVRNKRNVYISCRVGVNRSCLIAMAYLVKYENFTSLKAYEYIKSKRIQVKNGHYKILQKYEKLLLSNNSNLNPNSSISRCRSSSDPNTIQTASSNSIVKCRSNSSPNSVFKSKSSSTSTSSSDSISRSNSSSSSTSSPISSPTVNKKNNIIIKYT